MGDTSPTKTLNSEDSSMLTSIAVGLILALGGQTGQSTNQQRTRPTRAASAPAAANSDATSDQVAELRNTIDNLRQEMHTLRELDTAQLNEEGVLDAMKLLL